MCKERASSAEGEARPFLVVGRSLENVGAPRGRLVTDSSQAKEAGRDQVLMPLILITGTLMNFHLTSSHGI